MNKSIGLEVRDTCSNISFLASFVTFLSFIFSNCKTGIKVELVDFIGYKFQKCNSNQFRCKKGTYHGLLKSSNDVSANLLKCYPCAQTIALPLSPSITQDCFPQVGFIPSQLPEPINMVRKWLAPFFFFFPFWYYEL